MLIQQFASNCSDFNLWSFVIFGKFPNQLCICFSLETIYSRDFFFVLMNIFLLFYHYFDKLFALYLRCIITAEIALSVYPEARNTAFWFLVVIRSSD